MSNQDPTTPEELARRAYLADEIAAAREIEAAVVAEQEAKQEAERQRRMAAAIEGFRALVEPLIRPTIRDALQWRYEPYQDVDDIWQAAACITFNGVYLRLQRAPTIGEFHLRLIHPLASGSQIAAEYWTPARLERELLLTLGELEAHLRALAEAEEAETERRQRDAWAEIRMHEWNR